MDSSKRSQFFIVDKLLKGGQIHLINGASGAGKSTWMAAFLKSFQKGEPIYGYPSHPTEWLYIALDRGKDEITPILDHVGLSYKEEQIISLDEVEVVSWEMLKTYIDPEVHKLIIIEAMASIFKEGKEINDYIAVRAKVARIKKYIRAHNLTILASVHDAKSKPENKVKHIKERILGSAAWGGMCSTVISVDKDFEENGEVKRSVTISPRDPGVPEFTIPFVLENGYLVLPTEGGKGGGSSFESTILSIPDGEILTTEWLQRLASQFGLAPSTCKRWISEFIEVGLLERISHGRYKRLAPISN